jgi:hypothetical protein
MIKKGVTWGWDVPWQEAFAGEKQTLIAQVQALDTPLQSMPLYRR